MGACTSRVAAKAAEHDATTPNLIAIVYAFSKAQFAGRLQEVTVQISNRKPPAIAIAQIHRARRWQPSNPLI
jgi:hypothetical protein